MAETLSPPFDRELIPRLGVLEPDWMIEARLDALARYESLPLPTDRTQGWRRTNFKGIDLTPLPPSRTECDIRLSEADDKSGIIADLLEEAVPRGMARQLEQVHKGLTLGKFSALAQAAWQAGGYIGVPPGVEASDPIYIDWKSGPYPRLLIVLGKNARATVVEQHTHGARLVAGKVDLVLGDGARLNYLHVQDCPRDQIIFSHQHATVGRDAKLVTLNFGIGAKFARTDVEVELVGQGAESDMLGLVFAEGDQQFDYHTLQGHRSPNPTSDLLFKSALDDRSHSSYTGIIIIDRGAQRSNAYQANRNLLLGAGAHANTEPMLEIEADDVRCTHGATVGPVDEEQLFYAESRGLSPDAAARLIVEGFFKEVFEKFGQPGVTEALSGKVTPHLERVGAK